MTSLRFKIRNLTKIYDIEKQQAASHRSFREEFSEFFRKNRQSEKPSQEFVALNNCSLDIYAGETVALIGRNGSGKSTLLKILARVAHPSQGEVEIWGRTCALLEVGTGFHLDLTGRENIYLSGAILGMRFSEIKKRLDEIISFAQVETFIDTPVKKYSSGMFVRLAFSVMAHLNSDNLLLDEVLAVGDAPFQKKCREKIEMLIQEGRTIIVVSHDLTAVERLCKRGIWLGKGEVKEDGPISEVVASYLSFCPEEIPVQAL